MISKSLVLPGNLTPLSFDLDLDLDLKRMHYNEK